LDCFAILGEIYVTNNNYGKAKDLEKKLLDALPPLRTMLNAHNSTSSNTNTPYLQNFLSLSFKYHESILSELQRCYVARERIRDIYRSTLEDFMYAGTDRVRLSIMLK
jgi:hypothetical protein